MTNGVNNVFFIEDTPWSYLSFVHYFQKHNNNISAKYIPSGMESTKMATSRVIFHGLNVNDGYYQSSNIKGRVGN